MATTEQLKRTQISNACDLISKNKNTQYHLEKLLYLLEIVDLQGKILIPESRTIQIRPTDSQLSAIRACLSCEDVQIRNLAQNVLNRAEHLFSAEVLKSDTESDT